MTSLRVISVALLAMLLLGCSKPKVITKIECVEVKVPIVYKLDRPNRPQYSSKDSIHSYLLKILEYTKNLEVIIDEHNRGTID